ncbi:MAG: AAA family ATPase [Vibrio sp.]
MSLPAFLRSKKHGHRAHLAKNSGIFLVSESENVDAYIQLWIYRVLFEAKQWSTFTKRNSFSDDEIAVFLGLEEYIDFDDVSLLPKIKKECLGNYELLLKSHHFNRFIPDEIYSNLNPLSSLLGLNEVEKSILGFLIIYQESHLLDETFDLFDNLSAKKLFNLMSIVLQIPIEEIKEALSPNNTLAKTSLLKIDMRMGSNASFCNFFNLFDTSLCGKIYNGVTDPMDIFQDEIRATSECHLKLSDYSHVKDELNMLKLLLNSAIKNKIEGVNIFIYGKPGTGKTQLVKLISKVLKINLYEVSATVNGNSMSSDHRLRAYSAAQHLLKNKKSLLLFDEVEDVFNPPLFSNNRTMSKAWMNNALETNPVPTIWVSNSNQLDPAYMRRYSLVLHLDTPPYESRMKVLKKATQGLVSKKVLEQMLKSEDITPAIATNTAKSINMMLAERADDPTRKEKEQLFISVLNQTLKASLKQELTITETQADKGLKYDPTYLNPSMDLSHLVERLQAKPNARLCFYGPPGTGKTQFGKYLAESLELPLVQRKGSDLLGMYVGETEQKIAAAFAEARQSKGILLIDEADSFLSDRNQASKSWERTMVNEMLVQMEQFNGIFIASTNLIDQLDEASMRRFDAKIKFDYLQAEAVISMLKIFCQRHKLKLSDAQLQLAQTQLTHVTPGDFAMLDRQQQFSPCKNSADLIERLVREQTFKADMKETKSMGFLGNL